MVSLAADLALALDRVAFARELGIDPDPWQEDLLRSGSDRVLLNITRQGGKSTMSALIALHQALYRPGSLVLCLAPAERQSKELFSKITGLYRKIRAASLPDSDRKLGMHLANGSRIEALPGTERTIRGFSGVDLLVVDEAARVDDGLVYAVRPMLAVSGGRLLMLSTPYGKRGVFHQEWTSEAGEGWERFEVPAQECPRIPPAFLEAERQSMPAWWFEQEYECNPPEAPVWMGDYSFQPLGDVKVGDEVVGWHRPRTGSKRYLTRAAVEAVGRREAEIVEVRMTSGSVIYCTPDHLWLTMSAGHGQDWFQPPSPGKNLVRVINPTAPLPENLRWDAAWLGGMYDGEGCADHIAQSRTHNPETSERIERVVRSLGLRASGDAKGVLLGGRNGGRDRKQALVDFLNWTQPTKRTGNIMDRILLGAHFRHPDQIAEVRPVGRHEVVSLQTTTGNYTAWGYASKNCKFMETEDQLFSHAMIAGARDDELQEYRFEGDDDLWR